jgi:hypothetical protein
VLVGSNFVSRDGPIAVVNMKQQRARVSSTGLAAEGGCARVEPLVNAA